MIECYLELHLIWLFLRLHDTFLLTFVPFLFSKLLSFVSTNPDPLFSSSLDGKSVGRGGSSDYLRIGMFGGSQQSGVSDLLLGAGGFSGGSLGNGFGNDTGAPSSSGSGGTASGTTAFDLNDFPSLGGGSANSGAGSSANNPGNGLAAALRQQQQLLAHQQMLQGTGKQQNNLYRLAMSSGSNGGANFNMATEDFPALPGAPPPSAGSSGNSGSAPSSSPSLLIGGTNSAVNSSQGGFLSGASRAPSNSGGLYGNELESGAGAPGGGGSQLDGAGLLGGGGLGGLGLGGLQQSSGGQQAQLNLQSSRGTSSSAGAPGGAASGSATGTALSGDYGLLGLLGVIRMTDADRNALALGSDLTMLGLNLGTSEHIYNTFASPWSESSGSTKEPHYQVSYESNHSISFSKLRRN